MLNSAENDPDPVFLTPKRAILYGHRDGALNQAIFDKYPETLLFLDVNTMMVIRVVSLLTEQVSSICTLQNENATRTSAGDVETCYIRSPQSLLSDFEGNRVFIGSHSQIGFITVYSTPTTTATRVTSTTTPQATALKTTTKPSTTTTTSPVFSSTQLVDESIGVTININPTSLLPVKQTPTYSSYGNTKPTLCKSQSSLYQSMFLRTKYAMLIFQNAQLFPFFKGLSVTHLCSYLLRPLKC